MKIGVGAIWTNKEADESEKIGTVHLNGSSHAATTKTDALDMNMDMAMAFQERIQYLDLQVRTASGQETVPNEPGCGLYGSSG